jgi:hypothetical protein
MAWFSPEQKDESLAIRAATREAKVEALKKAQKMGQVGTTVPPGSLLTAIMTLATAWTAANPFGPTLDPEAMKRPATLWRSIAEAVRLLSKPGIDGD